MERPRVILHNEVSLDGRIDWIEPDLGRFYSLAGRWDEDATLVGTETVLRMENELPVAEGEGDVEQGEPAGGGSLLVVTDSGGRVRCWPEIRSLPYWKDVLVLCSSDTPKPYLEGLGRDGIDYLVTGGDRVDLAAALAELKESYGVGTVRVDSGGTLSGALLRGGLVDEVSVLLEPRLVGGSTNRSFFRAPDLERGKGVIHLNLAAVKTFADDTVWLRYDVLR